MAQFAKEKVLHGKMVEEAEECLKSRLESELKKMAFFSKLLSMLKQLFSIQIKT